MQFHEKYLDVLQNLEFGIVKVYRENSDLIDYEVIHALEALINYYVSEKRASDPRHFSLSDRAKLVFESVKLFCEVRLGRDSLQTEGEKNQELEFKKITIDEIIDCLKKILNSAKKWNKHGGRQAYLDFVSEYIK